MKTAHGVMLFGKGNNLDRYYLINNLFLCLVRMWCFQKYKSKVCFVNSILLEKYRIFMSYNLLVCVYWSSRSEKII